MNFKSLLTGITAAGVALTGVALGSAPAHALSIGSQVDAIWFGDASADSFDFYQVSLPTGGGPSNGFVIATGKGDIPIALFGTVKDIPSLSSFSPIDDWLFFTPGADYNFNLNEITGVITNANGGIDIGLKGLFEDGTPGEGVLTSQLVGAAPRSWSATIVAVPTPALLPGLLGLGVAALRKRGEEDSEEANV